MGSYTDLLYARPSFIEGMARALDLGGTLNEYNQALTPQQADYLALQADWFAVCADLNAAYDALTTEVRHQDAQRHGRA